ncbi:hypothetical protein OSB04_011198 [Centaurea solstitialis]|uniref:Uncharacterized protein n=1 Tax=Centaurea solstitialis TaxID=347529 RepID=A0AA38TAP2_9ASTR|nr:hypothetical protein OSB04_011198 [Centaurea solstitialis]
MVWLWRSGWRFGRPLPPFRRRRGLTGDQWDGPVAMCYRSATDHATVILPRKLELDPPVMRSNGIPSSWTKPRTIHEQPDYGITFLNTHVYIDNNSAISIVNNPVKHSKTKHIEIKYHFIRDSNEKKLIQVLKVHTDYQYVDLFTKAFDVGRFKFLITSVGMINSE